MKNTISIFREALFIIIFPIIPIFANDSIINLLYYHPSVKILDKQKFIGKKVSANTYIAKVYGVDSRFINSQEKVKGVDIVKKIRVEGLVQLEFTKCF